MLKKSISIIILTYNCANVLVNNLQSLLMQKFPTKSLEIIIIDDASKDGTQKILHEIKCWDQRIEIYKLTKNHGNGFCKNLALSIATGEIIFFIDDHVSFTDKNTISKMYSFLKKNPTIGGVCGNYISTSRDDLNICRDIRRYMIYNKNYKNIALHPEKFIPFSIVISALNRKIINNNSLFPTDFKKNAAEDIFFQIKQYLKNIIVEHNHNISLNELLIKSKRELNGFSYILGSFADDKYFRSQYLPCFFSFPLLFWIFLCAGFFINIFYFIALILLSADILIIFKIFYFKGSLLSRFKSFTYCIITEMMKIFFVIKTFLKKPNKIGHILTLLLKWELKKIIYIYENKLKKSRSH